MSLVVLLVIEFAGWIAFNRITPFSTPRTTIAMSITTLNALLMVAYASLYEPPLIDTVNLWIYALVNALLALSISFVHLTRCESATTH